MKHLKSAVIALMVAALSLLTQPLQVQAEVCTGINQSLNPLGYQQLAVSNTAVGVTLPAKGTVRVAIIQVEANPIRFRDDGTDPTASVGTLINPNVTIVVCGSAIGRFRAIRSGSDASLSIGFYGN